jgi:hypothetical protein
LSDGVVRVARAIRVVLAGGGLGAAAGRQNQGRRQDAEGSFNFHLRSPLMGETTSAPVAFYNYYISRTRGKIVFRPLEEIEPLFSNESL